MATQTDPKTDLNGVVPKDTSHSDMHPAVVKPGSKADPSVSPKWEEHVEEYFNQDATHGEAIPMATHETKK